MWAAIVSIAVWIWVVPLISDAAGVGRPDGTVTVQSCFDSVDFEGNVTGVACRGPFTPWGAVAETGTVITEAAGEHRVGTVLEVWVTDGRYQESSVALVMKWVTLVLLGAAFGWPPLVWAALSDWKEELEVDGLVAVQLILILAAGLLGLVLMVIGGVIDAVLT